MGFFSSKYLTYISSLKHTFRRYLVPKFFWAVAAASLKDVLSDPDKCRRFGALAATVLLIETLVCLGTCEVGQLLGLVCIC